MARRLGLLAPGRIYEPKHGVLEQPARRRKLATREMLHNCRCASTKDRWSVPRAAAYWLSLKEMRLHHSFQGWRSGGPRKGTT